MATVSRGLPSRPHLDVPKREARALLKDFRAGKSEALERVARRHPRFKHANSTGPSPLPSPRGKGEQKQRAASEGGNQKFLLNDAQLVIAHRSEEHTV